MCEFCDLSNYSMYDEKIDEFYINEVGAFESKFFLNFETEENEYSIPIKYCPMCGVEL